MDEIVEGIRKFRRDVYPQLKPLYDKLVREGAKPRVLMIGCSDSRVAFETLTGCSPGELFIVRNVGNIVPRYGAYMGGVTASIEFAVTAMPIEHIVVCGHTHCGAMNALLKPEISAEMPAVQKWVAFARVAKQRVERADTHVFDRHLRAAIAENVKLQLENLATFPCIEQGIAARKLKLHGWVYEIENGDVVEWDGATQKWLSLTEREEDKRDVSGRFGRIEQG
jgi:carbonic anhydrase